MPLAQMEVLVVVEGNQTQPIQLEELAHLDRAITVDTEALQA
jgi:hypothetical protein